MDLGDLERLQPISTQFGYDRGTPVDRYYIENFLRDTKERIHGTVLDIGDNDYTYRFGSTRVKRSEVLHVDASNPLATYVGDLCDCPQLPSDHFDCIVLTQTLNVIFDVAAAILSCHRILKPGGALLLTVPGISNIAHDQWGAQWYWSFSDQSVRKLLKSCFLAEQVSIRTHGNVLAATAFLYGMAWQELTLEQLDHHDPHYQVTITGIAIKT